MKKLPAIILFYGFWFSPGFTQVIDEPVKRYDGHKVVRVTTRNELELNRLLQLSDDVWSESIGVGPLDARVSPNQFLDLAVSGLQYEVLIDDVQALIDEEALYAGVEAGFFDDYHTYDEINAFMQQLAASYPNLAQIISLGNSVQGRVIYGLRITGPGSNKPAVFYESLQHAREWISPTVTLYLAQNLLTRYGVDPEVTQLVDGVEWFLIPICNPDGYVHSWSTDRMWRKNRRNNGGGSYGVDLNRNWSVGWGGSGSSGDKNSEIYRGTAPFSEPETKALSDFMAQHSNIVAFLDLHSYSQLILWPWGYIPDPTPQARTYEFLGEQMAQRIQNVHQQSYAPKQAYELYPAAGVSTDWAYGARGLWSIAFELRDRGMRGFLLPKEQIIPQCEEMWPAILYFTDWVATGGRERFVPQDIWMLRGNFVRGTLQSLAWRDGDYWEQNAIYDPSDPTAYLISTLLADGYSRAGDYGRGNAVVVTKTSSGVTKFRLRGYRFDAGAWVVLYDQTAGTQTDVTISVRLEDFAPVREFIRDSDHKMQLELRNSTSNRLAGFFRHSTDLVEWDLWP